MCNYSQLLKELSSMYHEGEKILAPKNCSEPTFKVSLDSLHWTLIWGKFNTEVVDVEHQIIEKEH